MLDKDRKSKKTCCRKIYIVYKATCVSCEEAGSVQVMSGNEIGTYIGEPSRTLVERATEHVVVAMALKEDNFIVKHWINCDLESSELPVMRFRIIRSYRDTQSRLSAESVWIDAESNLNSKND